MLVPNHLLQNRYRIVGLLGQGGMGHVYEAVDTSLDLTVAIKETFAQTDSLKRAFEREAKLLAKLQHSVLPRVSNHFVEGDGQFLVMDYIQGHTLLELLDQRDRPFSPGELFPWIEKLLQALEYLHERPVPVIHRDIKPANVKVDGDAIYLLDFGLAKGSSEQLAGGGDHTLTSVFGYTAAYAPVEQIMNTGTTARSDLYSLGATIYHLVTGTIPVKASLRYGALDAEQPDPLIPADQYDHRIPATFAAVLSKAMAVKQKDRFASAAQMRSAFRASAAKLEPHHDQIAPTVVAVKVNPPESGGAPPTLHAEQFSLAADKQAESTPNKAGATDLTKTVLGETKLSSIEETRASQSGLGPTVTGETQAALTQASGSHEEAVSLDDPVTIAAKLDLVDSGSQRSHNPAGARDAARPGHNPATSRGWVLPVIAATVVLFAVLGGLLWKYKQRDIPVAPVTVNSSGPTPSPVLVSPTPGPPPTFTFVQDLPQQEGTPWSVAISADGERIVSGGSDGKLRFWVGDTLRTYLTIDTHKSDIYAVAFSPDSKLVSWGGKAKTITVTDSVGGMAPDVALELKGHTDAVTYLAFSPNGKLLASASRDKTVRLWDIATGEVRSTFADHRQTVWCVAFSADGKYLASASADKTVVVWNLEDRSVEPLVLNGFDSPVVAVAFSPDGRFLAASGSIGLIRVWKAKDNFSTERNMELPSDKEITVTSLAFSADSRLLFSASYDGLIRVWETGSWSIIQTLSGSGKPVLAVALSSDLKTIVSAGEDGQVKIWR